MWGKPLPPSLPLSPAFAVLFRATTLSTVISQLGLEFRELLLC
uniref:Uncharacterized protein n=1 Tax=Nelumbo nucifera TaxID=4432 RepID=A0A822ZPS9_NELNU|nr:TPA_asm: hypothetical protein HUJ06_002028 [Nelumbo nucifera]